LKTTEFLPYMPLYEYKCDQCGEVFEIIQRFSDEPLATHAVCGGKVERLLSAPALQFKGSGWYVTDYARGSNGEGSGSKDKDSGSKDKDSGSKDKAETKPAGEPKNESKKSESGSSSSAPASTSSTEKH
jgi:putative FmdB family regulatory protein